MDEYDELIKLTKKAGLLGSANELLSWDQEVMMPKGGSEVRAMEMGAIAQVAHEIFTQPRVGELLSKIDESKLDEKQKANVREIRQDYERSKKVPNELVKEMAETGVTAMEFWREAREKNEYGIFKPWLAKIIDLNQQYTKAINPDKNPFEVIFADYETDISVEDVNVYFQKLKDELIPLIKKIGEQKQPSKELMSQKVPIDIQKIKSIELAKRIGYDFEKGRLDVSTHPFTAAFGRITTRYDEGWLSAIMSTLHESGHGMYEHNLSIPDYGTPLGESRSLSVHESQSRFWENNVGRSKAFWKNQIKSLSKEYNFGDIDLDTFYKMINMSEPGFIRVNADELTYPMHIIIRFEIEQKMMDGSLLVEDIPKAWNEKMEQYLGITPPSDSLGCLQDVHWASGGLGYFPTYALGSMIAAQIYYAVKDQIPDFEKKVEDGNFDELRAFLKDKIHTVGKLYPTKELVKRVTGKDMGPDSYIKYLKEKFTEIYQL